MVSKCSMVKREVCEPGVRTEKDKQKRALTRHGSNRTGQVRLRDSNGTTDLLSHAHTQQKIGPGHAENTLILFRPSRFFTCFHVRVHVHNYVHTPTSPASTSIARFQPVVESTWYPLPVCACLAQHSTSPSPHLSSHSRTYPPRLASTPL